MSDAEDGEAFDKEAEKEKLREQLEREEENRRSTEHMSELLLKGATMTNKHCDNCGDPLFRHDGREFCPTCGAEAGGDGGGQEAEAAGAEGAGSGAHADAGRAGTEQPPGEETSPVEQGDAGGSVRPDASTAGVAPRRTESLPVEGEAGGDVGAARQALVRKLSALAREAEATDDVGRARELLAATREAAEALAAIDSLSR